jgi:N-glycosylase/DNA lyase
MIKISIPHFSLSQICQSGQCFRMYPLSPLSPERERYQILAGNRKLEIEQQGQICLFHCEKEPFEKFWYNYFDLNADYDIYQNQIDPKDRFLLHTARFGWGIHILRQDLWEMIVSFLISQ